MKWEVLLDELPPEDEPIIVWGMLLGSSKMDWYKAAADGSELYAVSPDGGHFTLFIEALYWMRAPNDPRQ